jgi:hypothetical protein
MKQVLRNYSGKKVRVRNCLYSSRLRQRHRRNWSHFEQKRPSNEGRRSRFRNSENKSVKKFTFLVHLKMAALITKTDIFLSKLQLSLYRFLYRLRYSLIEQKVNANIGGGRGRWESPSPNHQVL